MATSCSQGWVCRPRRRRGAQCPMAAPGPVRAGGHGGSTRGSPGIARASPCSGPGMCEQCVGETHVLGLKPEVGGGCAGARALPGGNSCNPPSGKAYFWCGVLLFLCWFFFSFSQTALAPLLLPWGCRRELLRGVARHVPCVVHGAPRAPPHPGPAGVAQRLGGIIVRCPLALCRPEGFPMRR